MWDAFLQACFAHLIQNSLYQFDVEDIVQFYTLGELLAIFPNPKMEKSHILILSMANGALN